MLEKIMGLFRPEIGVARGQIGQAVLPKSEPLHSNPPGRFSVYWDEEVAPFFAEHGNMGSEELALLPQLVYDGCKALGLLRPEIVHFMVKLHDSRAPSESSATVCKISPAIIAPNGNPVARSLIIFKPPFLWDMHGSEDVVNQLGQSGMQLNSFAREQIAQGLRRKRKVKCGTLLAHELVHVFVTDEYRKCFKGWRLAELELFTDAITVAILRKQGVGSLDEFSVSGFIEGAAYLSNQLRAQTGDDNIRPLLDAMEKRADELIEGCRARVSD